MLEESKIDQNNFERGLKALQVLKCCNAQGLQKIVTRLAVIHNSACEKSTLLSPNRSFAVKINHLRSLNCDVPLCSSICERQSTQALYFESHLESPLKQLLRVCQHEIDFRCAMETKSGNLEISNAAGSYIEEARKFLDYFFIAFCKSKYGSIVHRAQFPRVPFDDTTKKEDANTLLQSWIKKTYRLKTFVHDYPKLFNYLLSIQPLINSQYEWLDDLYTVRNTLQHEKMIDEAIYKTKTKTIDIIQLASKVGDEIYRILYLFQYFAGLIDLTTVTESSQKQFPYDYSTISETLSNFAALI